MKSGHVYILANHGLGDNVYKVGYTMENLVRLEKINQRGYAGLFGGYYCVYKRPCQDARMCEQVILNRFAANRISTSLELVRIDLQILIEALDEVCMLIDDGDEKIFSSRLSAKSSERRIKKQGKIDFMNNITYDLNGCFIPAPKIKTTVVNVSNGRHLIETNCWNESYDLIKNILKDNGLKMTGANKRYQVNLLRQEIFLIDSKYMMQGDAPVTKLKITENQFMHGGHKCFEVEDTWRFSFIPELQEVCMLEVIILH